MKALIYASLEAEIESGKITINDARRACGLQPLDDPRADELLSVMQNDPEV